VRVIAGSRRGATLLAPRGAVTRPTSARVREAVFDALCGLVSLEGSHVVDLFAGSGAYGIEALSRGAARVVFVERAPAALATLRRNLERLGLLERAEIVGADALAYLRRTSGCFDIAFVDPPYRFGSWSVLLSSLPAALAVLEGSAREAVLEHVLGEGRVPFEAVRTKRYGDTLVVVARRSVEAASVLDPAARSMEATTQ
jgi:16S rRNA (guanine966-N2)-methyltransferase